MTTPHHDCPTCPKCGGPYAVSRRLYALAAALPTGITLHCPHCGHAWAGTAAEVERAMRADAAWTMNQTKVTK